MKFPDELAPAGCPPRWLLALALAAAPIAAQSDAPPGEQPAIPRPRITQEQIEDGSLTVEQIRAAGLIIFSTPFNKLDGYGDGPMDLGDPVTPGGRPTLQDNGTFLRVNGLDAQTCMECHSVGSNAVVPFRFAVGGVGSSSANAMAGPNQIDVDDSLGQGFAFFNGRYINPPFLFGSGGVELLGREMTAELQRLEGRALRNPGQVVELVTKGVSFGSIVYDADTDTLDTSAVEGVDRNLVVRPFGRKGEFLSVRDFDVGAMQFHFGMQPVELVGARVDDDGDGVIDEVLVGELSALHVFGTNLERPTESDGDAVSRRGAGLFDSIGCAECHQPFLDTRSPVLTYAFPEVPADPQANVYFAADLHAGPAGFELNATGGIRVPLFSDLKRHDMGPGLAESVGGHLDAEFITARLWGVADTAPYLHDGRATTLSEAIELHGGEARGARDAFRALADDQKVALLEFLRTLRTPLTPAADLLETR